MAAQEPAPKLSRRFADTAHRSRCGAASEIVEFVEAGSFGLASGGRDGGGYERLWFAEPVGAEEVAFEASVFLMTKEKVEALREAAEEGRRGPEPAPEPSPEATPKPEPGSAPEPDSGSKTATLRLTGTVPPEIWNRLGTKILPKLRSGDGLSVGIDLSVNVDATRAASMEAELRQVLSELDLGDRVRLEYSYCWDRRTVVSGNSTTAAHEE